MFTVYNNEVCRQTLINMSRNYVSYIKTHGVNKCIKMFVLRITPFSFSLYLSTPGRVCPQKTVLQMATTNCFNETVVISLYFIAR